MKQLIISLSFLMTSLLASGQSSGNQTEITEKQHADTLRFSIYGMDCPGCAQSLEKQVNKLGAVKSSSADWRKQLLEVVIYNDSLLHIEALNKRVNKANFTLDKKYLDED